MSTDPSLWSYVADAGLIVKTVLLILLAASVMSWTYIFQRMMFLKRARLAAKAFEKQFWSGTDLQQLFQRLSKRKENRMGLANIFHAGFTEFERLSQQSGTKPGAVMEGVERAMHIAKAHELENLEQHLSFLATVGSTSPYVGLFGTVWGIMTAFRGLADVQQATVSMVAPGISEALIATAMGLFAAIPAVIAYNRYSHEAGRIANHFDTFQDEFTSILHRQAHHHDT